MTDLQDEIQRWDQGFLPMRMETLMEAARKYANPDYEAAAEPWWAFFEESGHTAEDTIQAIVDAALGVTEKNELRAPGPIRELSEILDDITEDE